MERRAASPRAQVDPRLCQASHVFSSLARPTILYPEEMVARGEVLCRVCKGEILETGIAKGNSIIQTATLQVQLNLCDAIEAG